MTCGSAPTVCPDPYKLAEACQCLQDEGLLKHKVQRGSLTLQGNWGPRHCFTRSRLQTASTSVCWDPRHPHSISAR